MNNFEIEMTDTYGGDANYCWVKRYRIPAKTIRGAINKLARKYGSGWRFEWSDGQTARYNLTGAAICCFVSYSEE